MLWPLLIQHSPLLVDSLILPLMTSPQDNTHSRVHVNLLRAVFGAVPELRACLPHLVGFYSGECAAGS